jgi:hypothetical protein
MKTEGKRAVTSAGEVTRELRLPEPRNDLDNVVAISSAQSRRIRARGEPVQSAPAARDMPESSRELEVLVDGKRVVVEADRELVLKCGKASITLTRAGKIILRGTHVVSRSSGSNRVQGTQVRIN